MYDFETPEMFSVFLAHTPTAVAMLDREMRYRAVSQQWLTDYGLTWPQIEGRSHSEVFSIGQDGCHNFFQEKKVKKSNLATAENDKIECWKLPDGTKRWVKWRSQPWHHREGEVAGTILVTEMCQQSDRWPKHPEFFKSILNQMPDVVGSLHPHTHEVLYLNPTAEILYGRTVEEFYQNSQLRLESVHPEDRDRVAQFVSTILKIKSGEIEYRIIRSDGEIRHVRDRQRLITDNHNTPLRIDSILTDITEQIQERQKQENAIATLQESKAHFYTQTANLPGVIYQYISHSEGCDRFADLSLGSWDVDELEREEIQHNATSISESIHPEDLDVVRESVALSEQTQTPWKCEWRHVTSVGQVKWLSGVAQPKSQPNGNVIWDSLVLDISDRKQAEAEKTQLIASLQESEARNAAFVKALPDLLLRLETDGTIVDVKMPREQEWSLKPQTWLGKNIVSVVPRQVGQQMRDRLTIARSTGQTQVYEYRIRDKQGDRRDFEARIAVIDETELLAIVRDISDRKRAEAALREKERRFQAIFDSMFQFIGLLEPDGTVLEINQTALDFCGVEHSETIGCLFWETPWWREKANLKTGKSKKRKQTHSQLSPKQRQLKEAIARAAAGEFIRYEVEVRGAGDRVVAIDFSLKPVLDETGQVVLLIPEGRDVTDRKQAQEQLRISTERLELALWATDHGLWDWSIATGAVYFSPRWIEMLGYDISEIEANVSTWERLTHPDDLDRAMTALNRHFEDPTFLYALDLRMRTKSGEWKWVLAQGRVVERDRDGKPLRMAGTHKDISARKIAEEEAQRLTHNLQEAQRMAQMGNWEFDIATQTVTWSKELFRIFGLDPQQREPSIEQHLEQIHPDDRERWLKTVQTASETGISYEMEFRLYRPNGELRYAIGWGEAAKNEEGKIVRLYGAAMDITDRKQTEQAIAVQEQFLRTIYDGVEQAIFVLDVKENGEFRYAGWNLAVERILGISSSEGYGQTPEDIFGAEAGSLIQHRYMFCKMANIPVSYEHSLLVAGEETWWLATLNPLQDETGKIYRIIGTATDITQRKKAEAELRKQEEFLRTIYDGVEQQIFVVDFTEGEFRYAGWNPATESFLGISSAEGCGKTQEQLFGPQVGANLRQKYIACLQSGSTISYEEYSDWQGSENWWLVTLNPLHDETGRIYRIIGTSNNITQRKKAEAALQQSEAQFQELAEREALINRLSSLIRNSLDLDTILETTAIELYRQLKLDVCTFAWYRPAKDELEKMKGEANFVYEVINSDSQKSGDNAIALSSIFPYPASYWEVIQEAKNQKIPSFLGVDFTEFYGSISENLLNLEIYQIDEITTVSDPAVKQLLVSTGVVSLISLPIQTLGRGIGVFSCMQCTPRPWTQADRELLQAVVNQVAIAIDQAQLYTQARESAKQAKAKSLKLKETLRELQHTQTQLIQTEKMSSLGQMVAGVAHEINNPVNFISGNLVYASEYIDDLLGLVELYRNTYPKSTPEIEEKIESIEFDFMIEDLPKMLDSMKVGSDRIRDIVKSLRTFSRLDEADMKEVDLHENIDSTLLILQNRLKAKNKHSAIEVGKEYGQLPRVECYAGQLNQVFMNILSNAIDALEQTSELRNSPSFIPKIHIRTYVEDGQRAVIRIADNGCGMSELVKQRLFDPFFTTKPVGQGTGLGLAISYQIVVERHHGDLSCTSELQKGTEFAIAIPLRQRH